MLHMSGVIRKIKQRKGDYMALSKEIGISYSQLYRIVSGRTTIPKMDVWNSLVKWVEKK